MTKVTLFGSRVDDKKFGGDIDLYLELQQNENSYEKKIAFISEITAVMGEQKIDVIFNSDSMRAIEIEAKTKGIELNIEKLALDKYFKECGKHIQRIEEAYSDLEPIIPLSAQKYIELNKQEVQALDQYLYRFSKLQDTMGDKIFRMLVKQYQQSEQQLPFIDMLNTLEKLKFISSAKEWVYLRKVRNDIAHQCDDLPEENSRAINHILQQKAIIIGVFAQVESRYYKNS